MARPEPPPEPSTAAPPPVQDPVPNAPGADPAPEVEPPDQPPKVKFSAPALEKVKELMAEEEVEDGGLRISAHFGAGCALPLNFDLELDLEPDEGDYVLEGGGVRIFIAPKNAWAVDGLQVDYVESGAMGSGFAFSHPRGRARRGC